MSEIDLKLVANNQEYIRAIQGAMDANQRLYNQVSEGAKKEKAYIEDIKKSIDSYRQAKANAGTGKEQEMYNKKIREANVHLKEAQKNLTGYEKELKKVEAAKKSGTNATKLLSAGMLKLFGAVGGAIGIYKAFTSVIASTKTTADSLAAAKANVTARVEVLKKSIATLDFDNLIKRMRVAGAAAAQYARDMANIGDEYRSLSALEASMAAELTDLEIAMRDIDLSADERLSALENYVKKKKELNDENIRITKNEYDTTANANAALVDLNAQKLEELILFYNRDRELREDAIKFTEARDKKEAQLRNKHTKVTFAAGKRIEDFNANAFYTEMNQWRTHYDSLQKEQEKASIAQMEEYEEFMRKYNMSTDTNLDEVAAAFKKHQAALVKTAQDEKGVLRVKNTIKREIQAKQEEADRAEIEKRKKFLEELAKLEQRYAKENLEKLYGVDRINAIREFNLQEIQAIEANLNQMGQMTQQHYDMLRMLRQNANVQADMEIAQFYADEEAARIANELKEVEGEEGQSEKILALRRELAEKEADLIDSSGATKLRLKIEWAKKEASALRALGEEESDIKAAILDTEIAEMQNQLDGLIGQGEESIKAAFASWLNISESELDRYVGAFQGAFNQITQLLSQVYAEQVAHWGRERSLLDTRIAETQRAIDQEIEINKQGYASNIANKKKEMEELEAERAKALAKEEEAMEKQRKLDTLMQVSSLITSSAQIFQSLSGLGPIGVAIAIVTIGAMLAAFAKTKADAKKATKLAKGGSGTKTGMVTGASHAQGGESFTDNIEVEGGENWGVINKGAKPKDVKFFHDMVDAINKGKLESKLGRYLPAANVIIAPDASSKAIESEIKGLRKDLSRQAVVAVGNGYRIEKRGNLTRKIITNGKGRG
jgi:hypothetical protein